MATSTATTTTTDYYESSVVYRLRHMNLLSKDTFHKTLHEELYIMCPALSCVVTLST